jgi:CheY-like chemotaxis protein
MSKKTILFVDDEILILQSLKAQVKKHLGDQYRYEFAESASEAWEVIEELQEENEMKILIVVSDWLMPGIKGDELLIQIHQRFPNIVTVMLTGHADDDAVERAKQQANLYRCLRKPWEECELINTLIAGLA